MKTKTHSLRLLTFALATIGALTAGRAGAQNVAPNPAPTIITSAPYTITTAGYYQLGANLSYNGTGAQNDAIITINANNVTLDLGGHFLSGPTGNTATQLFGVYANERAQVTVQNGTVSHCYIGVYLIGNGTATSNFNNARVQNLVLNRCYYEGVDVEYVTNADILNNRVTLIGGTTAFTNTSVWGVYTYGTGIRVSGNALSNLTGTGAGTSYGVEIDSSTNGSVGGFAYGNQITGASLGIVGSKYQGNLTDNVATPFTGGTDAGGNN